MMAELKRVTKFTTSEVFEDSQQFIGKSVICFIIWDNKMDDCICLDYQNSVNCDGS